MTETNFNELVARLHKYNSANSQHIQLVINDRYCCFFELPKDCKLKSNETYYFASDWYRNNNAKNTISFDVSLFVYDPDKMKKVPCTLVVSKHKDLSLNYSAILYIYDKDADDKKILYWFNVIKFTIETKNIDILEIVSKLNYTTTTKKIKSPYDSCGLSTLSFDKCNGKMANLEYTYDGKLYFEVLDLDGYVEGDIIPLNSDKRKIVVDYVKVDHDNLNELVSKINTELNSIYKTKPCVSFV